MRCLVPGSIALTIALAGCAPEVDDADTQAGAISPAQAVANERFEVRKRMLSNERASDSLRETLGIASWTVYAVASRSEDVLGTIAFAVDGDGDVKYAVARMSSQAVAGESAAFFELTKDGVKRKLTAAAVVDITKRLDGDLSALDRKLRAAPQSASSAGAECALRLSLIGLGGVAAAFAGVGALTFGLATAATAAGAGGMVGAVVSTLAALAGAPFAASASVSIAVVATSSTEAARELVWTQTLDVCKRAVE